MQTSAMQVPVWEWFPWVAWITCITYLGYRLFHRKVKGRIETPSKRKVMREVGFWLAHACLVGVAFMLLYGVPTGLQFVAGFTVENALSIDNILIWMPLLQYFRVPNVYRGKVLTWGVYGAMILRAVFILLGFNALQLFQVGFIPLGIYLLWTAWKVQEDEDPNTKAQESRIVRLFQSKGWVSKRLDGDKFFTREGLRLVATKLLMVTIVFELVDLSFAFDSIPPVVAITGSTLVAWISNMCAVLFLRALYYVFERIVEKIETIKYGVTAVLVWVAVTTILQPARLSPLSFQWTNLHVPAGINLSVIVGLLAISALWGIIRYKRRSAKPSEEIQKVG